MKDYTRETVYIGIDVHKKTYSVTAICNGTVNLHVKLTPLGHKVACKIDPSNY